MKMAFGKSARPGARQRGLCLLQVPLALGRIVWDVSQERLVVAPGHPCAFLPSASQASRMLTPESLRNPAHELPVPWIPSSSREDLSPQSSLQWGLALPVTAPTQRGPSDPTAKHHGLDNKESQGWECFGAPGKQHSPGKPHWVVFHPSVP